MKNIKLIVCCDSKGGIGFQNRIPWNIPEDMKIFKKKTIGNRNNCVIMGKNTCLSIPKKYFPLNERDNCILSSTYIEDKDTIVHRNKENLLKWIQETKYDTYWIIGGKMIYELFLRENIVNEIHISLLEKDHKCDTFFELNSLKDYVEIEDTYYKDSGFSHKIFVK